MLSDSKQDKGSTDASAEALPPTTQTLAFELRETIAERYRRRGDALPPSTNEGEDRTEIPFLAIRNTANRPRQNSMIQPKHIQLRRAKGWRVPRTRTCARADSPKARTFPFSRSAPSIRISSRSSVAPNWQLNIHKLAARND